MMVMRMAHADESAKDAKLSPETRRRVWQFARPYRWPLTWFLCSLVVISVIGVIPSLVFRHLIDVTIPDGDRRGLAMLSFLVLFIGIVKAVADIGGRWLSAQIGEGLIFDLRTAVFDHVQRMPLGFFTRTRTGALTNRMNNDVIGAQRALTGTLATVVSNVITLVTTLVTVFTLEWKLTLLALALLPIFLIPAKRVGNRLAAMTREGMNLNADMNAVTTERFSVSGSQLVKLFGNFKRELDEFGTVAGRVRDIGIRQATAVRLFMSTLDLVGMVSLAAVYWIGGGLVISHSITLGTLAALTLLIPQIYGPLTGLTNARVDVMSAFVSFERVFEVLDAPNPIADAPDAAVLARPAKQISFSNVSFRYPDSADYSIASLDAGGEEKAGAEWVLDGIDVQIEAGWTVALVGPSGAGKSTMASLLPRSWDVTEGAVLIDGVDVRSVTQDSLRAAIGVVAQDPHLFHTTVAENLRYARPGATEAEMIEACRAAQILPVIESLPDGFETVVGERGYRMSGGEKQRLAIARMLLKDPDIVVLDEATSSLDTESEVHVQAALNAALEGRTSLVIAHRLSTITHADLILVIDQGTIVERGTHDELVALGGLYHDLYQNLVTVPAA